MEQGDFEEKIEDGIKIQETDVYPLSAFITPMYAGTVCSQMK